MNTFGMALIAAAFALMAIVSLFSNGHHGTRDDESASNRRIKAELNSIRKDRPDNIIR
jgi:hypothetical protein